MKVQRARNVIAKGKNGTNDSYVIIQNGKEKFQTSVKEQSIDPIWHEECDLAIEDKETDVIKLIVFHRNLFGLADEFLGQALVPLKEFDIYERPKSRWYELEGRSHKSSKKYRGEIEIRATFIVKNIPNERIKKRHNSLVHQSLLDIRDSIKNEHKIEKNEHKSHISGRKFSMADSLTKVPKLATRSISFKLDSLNTRRKSLVDKFLGHKKNVESTPHENESQYTVEEETLESEEFSQPTNGIIKEEMSQSQEEVRQLGKSCKSNKIVIEVKNEINSETENRVEEKVEIKANNEVKDNEIVNGFEDNESQTIRIEPLKSSSWKPLKGSLKRAFSTSNLLFTNSTVSNKPVPNINRDRSSTLTTISSPKDNSFQSMSQFHGPNDKPNNNNNNKYSAFINNENILRQTHNRERLLSALKKNERRHTIDFDEGIPNLKYPSIILEKRATQTSPDSLYSSFESLIQRKQSKTDYHQKYESLNKEELIQLIENQQLTIIGLNGQINDLEQYIDNLLVRVIETSPRLLQSSYRVDSLYKI